jgi:hypothetical protein
MSDIQNCTLTTVQTVGLINTVKAYMAITHSYLILKEIAFICKKTN